MHKWRYLSGQRYFWTEQEGLNMRGAVAGDSAVMAAEVASNAKPRLQFICRGELVAVEIGMRGNKYRRRRRTADDDLTLERLLVSHRKAEVRIAGKEFHFVLCGGGDGHGC